MSENNKVPVSFDYQGKEYSGFLSQVYGAGSHNWHLMINNYYYGCLFIRKGGFVFSSQTGRFEELSEYFGQVVTAWYA